MNGLLRFRWDEAADAIAAALASWDGPEPRATAGGRAFLAEAPESAGRLEVRVPLVLALPAEGQRLSDCSPAAPSRPAGSSSS